jgi:hypothetical protein
MMSFFVQITEVNASQNHYKYPTITRHSCHTASLPINIENFSALVNAAIAPDPDEITIIRQGVSTGEIADLLIFG